MVTSLKLADQVIWSSLVKFDNETVDKRFLELVWNRSVLTLSDKIISLEQSFKHKIISGKVTSSKTRSGGISLKVVNSWVL